ncbi:hypothetical protein B6I21_04750 [candidate division KSB1 bacterium 4572_119]|nr:MAG: hypothetical protein B6I21_04750 [candidate division KSB1 bacterium 4572_119]
MDILTGDNFKEINLSETDNLKINVGKIASDKTENVKLLALSIESDFDKLLESIQDTIKGKIFTFDCTRPDTWEYSNYLIHSIYDKFKLPSVVSVMNMDEQDTLNLEVIRYKLKLPKEIPAIVWNESDESSKERLLDHLLN